LKAERIKYNSENFLPSSNINPTHIGIIPDGTRRWALRERRPLIDAYTLMMQKLINIIDYLFDQKFKSISIYLSSDQNFKRPNDEILAVCTAESILCNEYLPTVVETHNTQVLIAGTLDRLPTFFKESLLNINELSLSKTKTRLYLCVAYNPIEEIVQACKKSKKMDKLPNNLWVFEPMNIVVRSSGDNTLSNFLPLQAAYSRLYFIPKYFNDLAVEDFQAVLHNYQSLNLRYGE